MAALPLRRIMFAQCKAFSVGSRLFARENDVAKLSRNTVWIENTNRPHAVLKNSQGTVQVQGDKKDKYGILENVNTATQQKTRQAKSFISLWTITNLSILELAGQIYSETVAVCGGVRAGLFHIHGYAACDAGIQPLSQALAGGILANARNDGLPDDLME